METHTEHSKKGIFANKRNIFILIGVVLFVALVAVNATVSNARKQKEEYAANLENYSETMKSGIEKILANELLAEEMGNYYAEAWSATVTKGGYLLNGKYYLTFNDATQAVSSYYQSQIQEIETGENEISKTMRALQNPPKEFEDAYDEMTELYKAHQKAVSLCLNPSGSQSTYHQQRTEFLTESISLLKSVESKIPDLE